MVTIPGPLLLDGRPDQEELVLNDIVQVDLKYAREVLDGKWGQDWALGYALTSQGLTVADPKRSGLSMTIFSGPILPTWPYQEWSISARSSG